MNKNPKMRTISSTLLKLLEKKVKRPQKLLKKEKRRYKKKRQLPNLNQNLRRLKSNSQ